MERNLRDLQHFKKFELIDCKIDLTVMEIAIAVMAAIQVLHPVMQEHERAKRSRK